MEHIKHLLRDAAERGIAYLESLDERPVFPDEAARARLRQALDHPLPEAAASDIDVLEFLDEFGSPATVSSAGGRYFGFVTGSALPATLASNWLAGAWDQNSFGVNSSPAISMFENAAMRWIKQVLTLPGTAEGTFTTGATMANFTCLAAARHQQLKMAGWDVEADGLFGAPEITVIVGEEAHSSLYKVLSMLGLGRDRVVKVPVNNQGAMRADVFPEISGPTIVCLQAGNVNSGAFDPATEIIEKAKDAWVHVDGAFGLWAMASPELKALATGYDQADSWATDAHKWLNVPYDCGAAVVRDANALRAAMSQSAAYLIPNAEREAINLTPDSSRRARALDVWAALKSLGRTGVAALVERNCTQARWMAEKLQSEGANILNDVVLNQVVVSFGDDERTQAIIAKVQASGETWCGGTMWRGQQAMRISVSSWATTQNDLERSAQAIITAMKSNTA